MLILMLLLLLLMVMMVVVHPWSRAIGVMTVTMASGQVNGS